ncbi:hypothetical protein BS47DRAFT_51765 [Hydnum rufescens UP504]|uniref:Uncharacterized protein n=1 Tax=Hydnum rufescens UP504 TaxID=1448309 RepID=A0A9P6ARN9_9AGAM|nr:hypothetical protein BS47DRAFT_51765 [Hydnum rufescens UP504]
MQLVASDTIIRQSQSLAALHEGLAAWCGSGASIMAFCTSWDLGVRAWLRILLPLAFFGVVSVFYTVTQSLVTVRTFNTALPISLTVSTALNISRPAWSTTKGVWDDPFTLTSYLWPQLGTNTTVVLPPGVNGTVLFSTLPSIMTPDVVFKDPYARDISVRCGIIPRAPGDYFNVSYTAPGESPSLQNDSVLVFNLNPGFEPTPGDMQWYTTEANVSVGSGYFALGGNKESTGAHPVSWFNDVLMLLTPKWMNGSAAAFAYISTRNDSLKLNPSISFAQPVQYVLQTQTWSFVNNDTNNAFHEDINMTFYIWPIGCSMFSQNITAEVRGDNVLLSRSLPPVPTPNPTPFIHSKTPDDPWEAGWAEFIYFLCNGTMHTLSPTQVLTPFQLQLLSNLNSTADSLALLGERLATAASLSGAMLLHFCHTPSTVPSDLQWKPVWANVPGSHSVIQAGLVVQTQFLMAQFILWSILLFVFIVAAGQLKSSDDVLQDGQVINLMSLLHNSSLPHTVIKDVNKDLQRNQAMHMHVL